tara:strand:- start:30 stop:230 length:201 start_codon:yes stop_codon:yes gene_type:complete
MAAAMNYDLCSDFPEELAYFNKIRKEMDDMKKNQFKKGVLFFIFVKLPKHIYLPFLFQTSSVFLHP